MNQYYDFYIALPYSTENHLGSAIREFRFEVANLYSKELMEAGFTVHSPISHSHPIAKLGLKTTWDFWQHMDTIVINVCREQIVLQLDGWRQSTGVKSEMDIFKSQGKIIHMVDPYNISPKQLVELLKSKELLRSL